MSYLQSGFDFIIGLGGPAMMLFVLTILAVAFRAPFGKSLEGGIRMAIALTGMSSIITLLTNAFGPALNAFVDSTGLHLSITDLGWAPLALITWSSVYTLYFALICAALNIVMIFLKLTKTLNVDLFNIWNLSIIGLLVNSFAHNMVVTSLFVLFVYTMMLLNADAMKLTINHLLGWDSKNITVTAHACFLIAPLAMLVNKLIDVCLPFIDKFDFDAETLNKRIGFWGSKFVIGAFLGVFIGLLGRQSAADVFTLAFTGGVALELFSVVGGWFGLAIAPLSDAVQNVMTKRFKGRELYVAIDWPIVAARPELWAVVNILAPILLLISMVLPGSQVMPLGGILMTVLVPALLIVTGGRVIRMTLIGTILIPVYLWAATLIAPFVTSTSKALGTFPSSLKKNQMFTSIDSNPIEKMLGMMLGKGFHELDWKMLVAFAAGIVVYLLLFWWYRGELQRQLKKHVDRENAKNVLEASAPSAENTQDEHPSEADSVRDAEPVSQ